jgi:hypothetical protein
LALHDHVHRLRQELEAAQATRCISAKVSHLALAALHREKIRKAAGFGARLTGFTLNEISNDGGVEGERFRSRPSAAGASSHSLNAGS